MRFRLNVCVASRYILSGCSLLRNFSKIKMVGGEIVTEKISKWEKMKGGDEKHQLLMTDGNLGMASLNISLGLYTSRLNI